MHPHRLLFSLALLSLLSACGTKTDGPETGETPVEMQYVGRAACAECHATETAAWTGSDHNLAMAPATPQSVLGDFSGVSFTHEGTLTRFFRDGDRYLVATEGPTGAVDTFQVRYTFGVRPLQQYLVEFPDGRLQTLTVAWDAEKKRWFSLFPGERIPPGDYLHWTGAGMNWNYMCADCHSTNVQKNFDLATNTYRTTWSEIDVSCEACHGPGEAHVARARAWNGRAPDRPEDTGLTVRLSGPGTARRQIETCAPCHARRRIVAPGFVPGDAFLDHYMPELLDEGLYYPDGQIQDEVYVYGSFLQSKMYAQGVRCSDCHDPHTARLRREGNALCTTCHAAPLFDTPDHLRHPAGSEGAQCVNCHMPQRTYMVVDPRRDHAFKVPRPDLTLEIGVPNACNGCHTDRSAEWARDRVAAWYGPARSDSAAYGRILAAGRAQQSGADETLAAFIRQPEMPALLRATAVSLLPGFDTPMARTALREALGDREPLVRAAAVRSLRNEPDDALYGLLAPLLQDSLRAVRVEAARILAPVASRYFPRTPEMDPSSPFWKALDEYRQSQEAVGDRPEAHLNLAVLHEALSRPADAEAAYQTALRLDSSFIPAHVNLGMFYSTARTTARQAGRIDEVQRLFGRTEAHLRSALRLRPDLADVHYALGLLLGEDAARMEEAAAHLAEAARLSPDQARMQYNAGLAYQHLNRAEPAERYLLAAHRLEPRNPDFLYALSVFYMQQARWPEALAYTDALLLERPGTPALVQQREHILGRMGS